MATQSAFETQIQAEQQAYLQEVEAEMARFLPNSARCSPIFHQMHSAC